MAALHEQRACWVEGQEQAEVWTAGNTDVRDWVVCKLAADPSERTQYGVLACFVHSHGCGWPDSHSVWSSHWGWIPVVSLGRCNV